MTGTTGERPAREVSPQDEELAADWLKRIDAALTRPQVKKTFATFEKNRLLVRGIDPDTKQKVRANLHFANMASVVPQIYAKDPEYSVTPSKGVPETQLGAIKKFAETAEVMLDEILVKQGKLKKRAKRVIKSTFTTSVGWLKVCWQETKKTDPLIANQIKDTQDNIERIKLLREKLDNPQAGQDQDKTLGELQQTLAGLESQAEVVVARGITIDFVLSEDIIIVDASVLEISDYERSGAIAHRVWMSREQYRETFGYDCEKGKSYAVQESGERQAAATGDKNNDLLCVYEVWDQKSNRVLHVCEGEKGFCREPSSPDWTGERWYPFFLLAFNEVDGGLYPLSDIELTDPLVKEYNEARDDLVNDRRYALPLNIVRKGGSLTDEDMKRIANRRGGDAIMVEGVGGQPIGNDIWSGALAKIDVTAYNTQPARQDMEMLIGGGDAARGSVLEAKTATEAEILSQGLRSRSSERQDTMEDVLTDIGGYSLEMMLRKMPEDEVKRIAGPEAVWPTLTADEIFRQVSLSVRGGSTGKPDRHQEQDRWTKLLPVIEKTMAQVSELRQSGQDQLAEAVIELTRETLRRFDERLELDRYLPPKKEGEEEQVDPAQAQQLMEQAKQIVAELQAKVAELEKQLADKTLDRQADVRKAKIAADASIEVARINAGAKVAGTVLPGNEEGAPIPGDGQPGDPMSPIAEAAGAAAEA